MKEIIEKADMTITQTYLRAPLAVEKGQGCTLWDSNGKEYTDFLAGIATCNLGHAHPDIVKALTDQAEKLFHVSNLFYTIPQTELAAKLVANSFADRVFFCNSGAEANEAAIKLARKFFSARGEGANNDNGRHTIIAMEQSFHGRTMATLSATGQDKIKKGFEPLLPGFEFVPYNDLDALKEKMSSTVCCAVLVEPIQGEGGVVCPSPGYLKAVRQLCDDNGALLIFDEVQTGMGRTGNLFAYEHEGVDPDIMTLAKALGNGLPIGAMLAKENVAAAFGPGTHGSTFGGTPVICAAALEVLNVIEKTDLLAHCRAVGNYFENKLNDLINIHECAIEVRGRGLLLGLALTCPGGQVVDACRDKGFIINCIQDSVLRFAPPLIITTDDIDKLIDCLGEILTDIEKG